MTHAYFYYPFFGEIFRTVMDRIDASMDRRPRWVTIIFTDPHEVDGVRSTASEIDACVTDTGRFEAPPPPTGPRTQASFDRCLLGRRPIRLSGAPWPSRPGSAGGGGPSDRGEA